MTSFSEVNANVLDPIEDRSASRFAMPRANSCLRIASVLLHGASIRVTFPPRRDENYGADLREAHGFQKAKARANTSKMKNLTQRWLSADQARGASSLDSGYEV